MRGDGGGAGADGRGPSGGAVPNRRLTHTAMGGGGGALRLLGGASQTEGGRSGRRAGPSPNERPRPQAEGRGQCRCLPRLLFKRCPPPARSTAVLIGRWGASVVVECRGEGRGRVSGRAHAPRGK